MGFGEIERRRVVLGVSQADLSRRANINESTYWNLKTYPAINPHPRTLFKLADALAQYEGQSRPMSFEEIENRRTALGLSQVELCRRAGVSGRTYQSVKAHRTMKPRRRTLVKLAAALAQYEGQAA